MEVAPGIHRFETGRFNWYVVEDAGRLTLVDAGFPGHYAVFRRGLEEMGRSPDDLEAILITHAHIDHTGFAERVRKETGTPVFVHTADRRALGTPRSLPWWGLVSNGWRPVTGSMLLQATVNGGLTTPVVTEAISFENGARLEVPGRPEVIHAPGHTPGEVAFFLPDRGTLLSGDSLLTTSILTGRDGPQILGPRIEDDYAQTRRSLERFRDLGEITILPGHGPPWTGPAADAVAAALGE